MEKFKPKRKLISFLSGRGNLRLNRETAFVNGSQLSGMLDNIKFKMTIFEDGMVSFDEVDTKETDINLRERLFDDIQTNDVVGFIGKYVFDLKFTDINGDLCYLEVENEKPINKLKNLFKDKKVVSEKGLNLLSTILSKRKESDVISSDIDDNSNPVVDVESKDEVKLESSFLTEQFDKMISSKRTELENRIIENEKEISKIEFDIKKSESKLKEYNESLSILNERLFSMSPNVEHNGFLFFVSEKKSNETGLDESSKEIADKIADLMKLKKDVLFNYLTGGYFNIKVIDDNFGETELGDDLILKLESINIMKSDDGFVYRGDLNWHELVSKMIRLGFKQSPKFDIMCGSNSYDLDKGKLQ